MFRCAEPGLIAGMFSAAGMKHVQESEVACSLGVSGPEEYWSMMTEVAAPFVAALGPADAATVPQVKHDVITAMTERYPNGNIDGCGVLISAVK